MQGNGEGDIERLLGAAGARPRPGVETTAAVRAAVEAEWRAAVERRRQRHRLTAWGSALAAAATLGAVAVGWWMAGTPADAPRAEFAAITEAVGSVEWRAPAAGRWTAVTPGTVLHAGDRLRTAGDARVALDVGVGPALRLDVGSELEVADPTRVALERGAVYVDSRDSPRPLVIETPQGEVTHLGTRYQVRVGPESLVVAVRDGQVRLARDGRPTLVGAGEQLELNAAGEATRVAVATYGPAWAWAESVAPVPALDGLSLHDLVLWVAHETGRRAQFTSPRAEAAARATRLHGSVTGLTPIEALEAVIATTRFEHEVAGERILIGIADDAH